MAVNTSYCMLFLCITFAISVSAIPAPTTTPCNIVDTKYVANYCQTNAQGKKHCGTVAGDNQITSQDNTSTLESFKKSVANFVKKLVELFTAPANEENAKTVIDFDIKSRVQHGLCKKPPVCSPTCTGSTSEAPTTSTSELPTTSTTSELPTTSTTSSLPTTSTSELPITSTTSEAPTTSTSEAPTTSTSELPTTSTTVVPTTSTSELPTTSTTETGPTTTPSCDTCVKCACDDIDDFREKLKEVFALIKQKLNCKKAQGGS